MLSRQGSQPYGSRDRPLDLETGATLLDADDNAKSRRRSGGGGGRSLITRNLARLASATFTIAYKRWLTTTLLLWIAYRELFSPSGGGSRGVAHKYSYKYDPVMQRNVAARDVSAYPYASIEDLIIVCGHAVYLSSDYLKAGEEDSWYLEDYQKRKGQANTFVEQMRFGVREAANNPASLLVFSGGKTRRDAGSISEGLSYWEVSRAFGWFGEEGTHERAFTEEFARDSYENVLFSIARFKELTGHAPRNVTVVGYEFKRERFVGLHRAAIRFPVSRFNYVGTPAVHEEESAAGEIEVRHAFSKDPYGCKGTLGKKRESRDPFNVGQPYTCSNPDLEGLMRVCEGGGGGGGLGGSRFYKGELPW